MRNALKAPNPVCWQCGGRAEPDATYVLVLAAPAAHVPEALGFPVRARGGQVEVRVPIPRCRACRRLNRNTVITMLFAALVGAAMMPVVWAILGPRDGPPLWWLGHEDPRHVMVGVGLVVGFVVGGLANAWSKNRLGMRSLADYPAVRALREQGWAWPSSAV